MKQYLLLVSAIVNTLLVAYISIKPVGSYNQAEVSALFPTAITPASYTFSIWSLIYLSWFALGIYSIWKKDDISQKNILLLVGAQFLSTLWLIPSQSLFIVTSFGVMLILGAILSYLVTRPEKNTLFHNIVSFFFGWILIASIANFHQTLVALDVYIFPIIFSILSMLLGSHIVLYIYRKYNNFIPAIVLVWAFIGIIFGQENIFIIGNAIIEGIGITGYITYTLLKHESK